jgi:hypothetical protein
VPGIRRRRARKVTVATLLGLLAPALLTGCSSRFPTDQPGTAIPSGTSAVPAGVGLMLDRRAGALLRHDRDGWLATVDPADPAFLARQGRLADDLAAVPLTGWRYRPGGVLSGGTDRLELHTLLTYRLQGDTRDVRRDQVLTLTRSAGGWRVAGQRARFPEAADLWDLGPVAVRRGSRAVVIGAAGLAGRLPGFADDLDAAAVAVDRVWGTAWPRTVSALLPADQDAMAALLGPDHGAGLDRLAAVTTGDIDPGPVPGGGPRPTADRVVLNSGAFAGFGPVARRVVLTHEVTHLATRAAGLGKVPLWLEEGFADYVAYSGSGLGRVAIAGDLVAQARAGRAPTTLPGPEAFDAARGPVEASYAAAWLAIDLVAREAGPRAPVRFYREAASNGLQAAFRDVLGSDQAGFEARWRADIRSLGTGGAG